MIDVQMSKMDGLEAIRRIRQDAQIQDIPIIALAARAMMEDQKSCLAAGADRYLSKPVKFKQLREVVQQSIEQLS